MLDLLKRLLLEAAVFLASKSHPSETKPTEPPWLIAARKARAQLLEKVRESLTS